MQWVIFGVNSYFGSGMKPIVSSMVAHLSLGQRQPGGFCSYGTLDTPSGGAQTSRCTLLPFDVYASLCNPLETQLEEMFIKIFL